MNPLFDLLKDSGTQAMLVLLGFIVAIIAAVAGILAAKYAKAAPSKEDLKRVEEHTAATSAKLKEVETHLAEVKQNIRRVEENTGEASGHLRNVHTQIAEMKQDIRLVEGNTAQTTEHLENVHSGIVRINERMDKEPEREAVRTLLNRVQIRIMGGLDIEAPESRVSITTQYSNLTFTHIELLSESRAYVGSAPCEGKTYSSMPATHQAIVTLSGELFRRWLAAGTKLSDTEWNLYLQVYMTFQGYAGEHGLWRTLPVHLEKPDPPRSSSFIYRLDGRA